MQCLRICQAIDKYVHIWHNDMMNEEGEQKIIIGRTAKIGIPVEGIKGVPAKIDTGADNSSIWASELHIDGANELSFCLFAKGSEYYTGKKHTTHAYTVSAVRSAHGTLQVRYKIQMAVRLGGKRVRGTFTLADRSKNTYPVLIGCKLLNKKFLVDVAQGVRIVGREKTLEIEEELRKNPRAFFEKYHSNNQRGDIEA